LAERVGFSRQKVLRTENGHTKVRTDDLPVWARALRTTVEDLVS